MMGFAALNPILRLLIAFRREAQQSRREKAGKEFFRARSTKCKGNDDRPIQKATMIHEERRTARRPQVLTDERLTDERG
jgi:hypothetical protein